jgi:hypothetical protein
VAIRREHAAEIALGALTPILLATSPLLAVFQHNQTEIAMSALWMPLAISAATGTALFGIFWFVSKRGLKAGVLASLLVVALFYYGTFYDIVSGWGLTNTVFFPLWIVLIGVALVALLRTSNVTTVGWTIFAVAALLVLMPGSKIILFRVHNAPVQTTDPRLWPSALPKPVVTGNAQLPDIYYLVTDDYPRTDVLKEYFDYDNSPFIDELKSRGFAIAEQSRSPYSDSEMNMASPLNLDYLSAMPTVVGADSENSLVIKQVLEDNRASRFLKPLGYRYIHLGADNTTFTGDNPLISRFGALDNLTFLWLRQSILRPFGGSFGLSEEASNQRYRTSVLSTFDRLNAMPETPGPKFVFWHILPPHDPFIFGAQGQPVTFVDRTGEAHGARVGMKFFVDQLQFTNQKILESIDQLLAQSKTPPVIIFQADEGFEANEDVFGPKVMKDIRVKGLSAYYLPGKDASGLPQDLNTVNTFRYVFDLYFGTHLGMLESHSYSEGDRLFQFDEIKLRGDAASAGK